MTIDTNDTATATRPDEEHVELMGRAIDSIAVERSRQNRKWGLQRHSWPEWIAILTEEVGEASHEAVEEHYRPTGDLSQLREELIHVAAVAVQIVEHIDDLTGALETPS